MTNEQKAIELLKTRIDTMEVHLMVAGYNTYSSADLEDYLEACKFLNEVAGTSYDTTQIQQYIDSL